jgi:hypothetical protein
VLILQCVPIIITFVSQKQTQVNQFVQSTIMIRFLFLLFAMYVMHTSVAIPVRMSM